VAGVTLVASVLLTQPNEGDQASDAAPKRAGVEQRALSGMSVGQSARTSAFWLLLCGVALFSLAMGGVVTHLMALLTDRGLSVTRAGTVLAAVGGVSMFGRVLSGFIMDRVRVKKYVMSGFNLSLAAAICVLLSGDYFLSLVLFALLWGLATGAETDTLGYLVGAYFGVAQFGKIFGIMFSVFNLGLAAGSLFMGFVFDTRGSYDGGLGWLAMSAAAAALVISQIRQPLIEQRLSPPQESARAVDARNTVTRTETALAE
jgi:predicted MFS family arabinose efflux permease